MSAPVYKRVLVKLSGEALVGTKEYGIDDSFISDLAFQLVEIHKKKAEPWKITLVDTGESTMTGGRVKRIQQYVNNEIFCLTYGDGLADIDINALIKHHKARGKLATITGTEPPGRFGALKIKDDMVTGFQEKPKGDSSIINGGFFVLFPTIFDLLRCSQIY